MKITDLDRDELLILAETLEDCIAELIMELKGLPKDQAKTVAAQYVLERGADAIRLKVARAHGLSPVRQTGN